jgi:hypothetical protein
MSNSYYQLTNEKIRDAFYPIITNLIKYHQFENIYGGYENIYNFVIKMLLGDELPRKYLSYKRFVIRINRRLTYSNSERISRNQKIIRGYLRNYIREIFGINNRNILTNLKKSENNYIEKIFNHFGYNITHYFQTIKLPKRAKTILVIELIMNINLPYLNGEFIITIECKNWNRDGSIYKLAKEMARKMITNNRYKLIQWRYAARKQKGYHGM